MGLPSHLYGRGSFGGPNSGGYVCFPICAGAVVANLATGDQIRGFIAPCDMRIERITWRAAGPGAGTGTAITYSKASASFAVSGATTILASQDITADGDKGADDFASSAARNISKGDAVFIDPITQASTGTVGCLTFLVYAHVKGHVNTDSADD